MKLTAFSSKLAGPVCSKCNCDILSVDTVDGLDQQLVDPNRRLKCQDCKQQITASYDSGYPLRGHLSPVRQVDPEPISLQKDDVPIIEEYQQMPQVVMLGRIKPGLKAEGFHNEMSTTLIPNTTGLHTIGIQATGFFVLKVNGKDVIPAYS